MRQKRRNIKNIRHKKGMGIFQVKFNQEGLIKVLAITVQEAEAIAARLERQVAEIYGGNGNPGPVYLGPGKK